MELSTLLRQARERKRLSQQEVADHVGISQTAYANYESGKCNPRVPQALKIGELLDIELTEILAGLGVTISQTISDNKDQSKSGVFYSSVEDFSQIYKDVIQHERELFKERLKEKDETIKWLRSQLERRE